MATLIRYLFEIADEWLPVTPIQFEMADSVFGGVFYMTTGLHALHVIVGIVFLLVATIRVCHDSFTIEHHLG